jgi:hypothetical protein
VPPNIEFTTFFSSFTTKGAPNCHFIQVRVPPNYFSVLKGAVNQKRLKNIAIDYRVGEGNSLGFAGHIRDKLGIRGSCKLILRLFFVIKQILS